MAYGYFKDLAKRTALDSVLRDKGFNIAKNLKYDGYQRGLASIVYKFFDKKPLVLVLNLCQLADEHHKPIIREFRKGKVYSSSETIFEMLI